MWLNYTDREVEAFHPVCGEILNMALRILNLQNFYKVEHHRTVGSLEMDFVISNKETDKILCVVEVKRTIEAVLSTRYQLQAMGYVQELRPTEKEKEYYILTNLEAVAFFKYSSSRANVIDQLLSPGITTVARFSNMDKDSFIRRLSQFFAGLFERIINDDHDYFKSFRHFVGEVSEGGDNIISDINLWHSKFAALSYEYIRGSLNSAGRHELVNIRRLKSDIHRICQEAQRVNFNAIYGLEPTEYRSLPPIPSEILNELYELGSVYLDADAISDILFNLIAKDSPYPGAVPTDIELSKALGVISSVFCPVINDGESVMDPAAGSGNLLSVIPTFYPSVRPSQIKANDINQYLLQLLSFRLGLKFPRSVNCLDHPSITAYDIAEIPQEAFEDTKLIVLNPPYFSHTSNASNDYKSGILRRIERIKGEEATSRYQKTPLESAFIELVSLLAKEKCVVVCIVPLAHLYGMGTSDILFREMLLERFGLCCIFRYPQENIFKNVSQNTCILVGKIGARPQEIIYVTSIDTVGNLDYDSLKASLLDHSFTEANGIERQVFSRSELESSACTGWKVLESLAAAAKGFLQANLEESNKFGILDDSEDLHNNYRGRVGNSGGSDLLFPNVGGEFYNSIKDLVEEHLRVGIRTIRPLDNPYLSDCPTKFLDVSSMPPQDISLIAGIYKSNYEKGQARQMRKSKTKEDYIALLKSEARLSVPEGSILLARDCRRSGRAYYVETKAYASTNVWVFDIPDPEKGRFYHSWFCSIFYQLNCELSSKNHAGTRKMDAAEFASTFVPVFDKFTDAEIKRVIGCEVESFVVLNNPTIRECDKVWAQIISPENWNELLNETARYLSFLAIDRES